MTDADGKDANKSKWQSVSVTQAKDSIKTWAVRAGDVVDPAYLDENITFPLGPLLEATGRKEVTHTKIPMLDISQRGANAGSTMEEPAGIADLSSK